MFKLLLFVNKHTLYTKIKIVLKLAYFSDDILNADIRKTVLSSYFNEEGMNLPIALKKNDY